MIFSELYSAYYQTVAAILRKAVRRPLDRGELRRMVEEHAFGESLLQIEPALREGRWPLLRADGTTPIRHSPTMPLTTLEKQWLNAIWADPRMQLFWSAGEGGELEIPFPGIPPLFSPEDVSYFGQYADGDDYGSAISRRHFAQVLDAVKGRYPLRIAMASGRKQLLHILMQPEYLEYSEKDDKFRVIGFGPRYRETVNVGRIIRCERCGDGEELRGRREAHPMGSVTFTLTDERNALERVLMHFAHFEKQAERVDGKTYQVTVRYHKDDETEMVIRLLSFGPLVKVTAPQHFEELIRERLRRQRHSQVFFQDKPGRKR